MCCKYAFSEQFMLSKIYTCIIQTFCRPVQNPHTMAKILHYQYKKTAKIVRLEVNFTGKYKDLQSSKLKNT